LRCTQHWLQDECIQCCSTRHILVALSLDSTWLVSTSLSPRQAWDKLAAVVDKNDHILIVNTTGDTYGGWLPQKAWDWLRSHV